MNYNWGIREYIWQYYREFSLIFYTVIADGMEQFRKISDPTLTPA